MQITINFEDGSEEDHTVEARGLSHLAFEHVFRKVAEREHALQRRASSMVVSYVFPKVNRAGSV